MSLINRFRRVALRMPFRKQLKNTLAIVKRPIYTRRLRNYITDRYGVMGHPRVLILMNGGIGNAIEVTPLVQAVRMHWPRSYLVILAPGGDLFDDWCVVDRVATSLSDLCADSFDMTFETHATEGMSAVNSAQNNLGRIYSPPFVGGHLLGPEREYNMDIIRKLGYKGASPPLYVSLYRPGLKLPETTRRIILAPGGKPSPKWKNKRWPYYTELASALLGEYAEAHIYVVGTDQDSFDNPAPDNRRLFDSRGKFSLSETAWLMRHSTLVIGNDCGPMHIADAVKTESLIMFGPTCELKNGPLYNAFPISTDIDCRPCQYDEKIIMSCSDPLCLTQLSVSEVMNRIRRFPGMMNTPGACE